MTSDPKDPIGSARDEIDETGVVGSSRSTPGEQPKNVGDDDANTRDLGRRPDPSADVPPLDVSSAPTMDPVADLPEHADITEAPGTFIGPYKLLQLIGEGGFGMVFLAEQEEPIRRRVALKIIKAGMDTRAVIARFEAERQALAIMDHRNIARVLDAGSTATGRPFFVMELVKGIPITEYCDEAELTTRERLELFVDVCRAVQHAHQKGIIHRDLKPSNILVTLREERPVVKVIDFGIAKAIEQKLTEKTLFTAYGQMIGTPIYMSPEQAGMSELDVDTRSDVYSLGILLYELLTGATPITSASLQGAGLGEMQRRIREETPSKPSTRISTMADDLRRYISSRRRVSPDGLRSQCSGDLDWVVMKSLEKDRTRRYESASAFASDVERYLNSEPVSAVAPSRRYRLKKFVARHRRAVVTVTTVGVLLIAATVVSSWLAWEAWDANQKSQAALGVAESARAAEETSRKAAEKSAEEAVAAREEALRRLHQTERANDILTSVFEDINPVEVAESGRPLQDILADHLGRAITDLDADATGHPLLVAQMKAKLGHSLLNLGKAPDAVAVFESLLPLLRAELGSRHVLTLSVMNNLALGYSFAGEEAKALPLLEEAYEHVRETHGPDDEKTLTAFTNLAIQYEAAGLREKSLPMMEEVLERKRDVLGPRHILTVKAMSNLGLAYLNAKRFGDALPLFEESFEVAEAEFGPRHPQTFACLHNLAAGYAHAGQTAKALPLQQRLVEVQKSTLGAGHPSTLQTQLLLAESLEAMQRVDEALALREGLVESLTDASRVAPARAVANMLALSKLYMEKGELERALENSERCLERARQHLEEGDVRRVTAGENVDFFKKAFSAEKRYRDELAAKGPEHLSTLLARRDRAQFRMMSGRLSDAETDLVEILRALKGRGHDAIRNFTLAVLQRCLMQRRRQDAGSWKVHRSEAMAAAGLVAAARHRVAEGLLLSGYRGLLAHEESLEWGAEDDGDWDPSCIEDVLATMVELYDARGAGGDAAKLATARERLEARRSKGTTRDGK